MSLILERSLYLLSHLMQHIGDWFFKIASLLALERLAPDSGRALSALVLAKTIPPVFISPFGGILADKYDRSMIMLTLDCVGAISVLFFLLAIRLRSLPLFFTISVIRSTISALYEPSTKSIIPMIVPEPSSLKRAATINGMGWAIMLIFGGVIAGDLTSYVGLQVSFSIDSVTYFISALIISRLKGNYAVVHRNDVGSPIRATANPAASPGSMYRLPHACQLLITFGQMAKELLVYLHNSGFGGVVFLNATAAFLWGASDILNVTVAQINGNEQETSQRLGYLFSFIGVAYLLGPIAANFFSNADRPKSVQLVCTSSFVLMTVGWIGLSQSPSFAVTVGFSFIRGCGSGILWINSTLLLQTLTRPDLLGRVMALEFCLSLLMEAASAVLTGHFLDLGYSAAQISGGVAVASAVCTIFWLTFQMLNRGAAREEFNKCPAVRGETVDMIA